MSKRVVWLMLAVAVITGLVVADSLYRRLSQAPSGPSGPPAAPEEIPVVVAKKALEPGTVLTAEDLETSLETVPRLREEMPSGIFTQLRSLIGRRLKDEVPAGGLVLETSLASREEVTLAGLPQKVPSGYRAVGVFVDLRGGIQQFLRVGDHVDVVVTVEEQTAPTVTESESFRPTRRVVWSKVLLQDIEVLDVPGMTERADTGGRESGTFRADTNRERLPVVLAMSVPDAEKLSLAMQIGTIQLLKRGVEDKDILPTTGVTQDTLFAEQAKQVLIEVRFAEVDRTRSRNLGLDWIFQDKDWTASRFLAGGLVPQVPSTPNFTRVESTVKDVALSSVVNHLFEWRKGGPDITVALNALEEKGLVRTLATPNLLAVSGEAASFLAGGEFPIPVVQATTGTSASSSVTIEFKEFGIRLLFRPEVLSNDEIRLFVAPEVSVLDTSTGIQISGFSIPSLTTRRASTTVQMQPGESLVIGGLLSQLDTKTNKQIPYLGDIPILGKLFSSEKFKKEETELLVLVTPRLVKPSRADVKQPFSDTQKVGEALKQQIAPPPYQHDGADALRRELAPDAPMQSLPPVLQLSPPVQGPLPAPAPAAQALPQEATADEPMVAAAPVGPAETATP